MAQRKERRSEGAHSRIHTLARQIPRGRVASYGQLAAIAGGCTPRMAGYAMAAVKPDDGVPWHRVVNSRGRVSERPGADVQRAMLEAEGVEFGPDGTINLSEFGWRGPERGCGKEHGRGPECERGKERALTTGFRGFTKDTLRFYAELSRHNDKPWFDAHKDDYRAHVLEPSQEFVREMNAALRKLAPNVVTDTRTNGAGSIFRIYRDTRFSRDKTPYKTSLGIFFWEGPGTKMDSHGFYFDLTPSVLGLYVGKYRFSPDQLRRYREAVADSKTGPALTRAITRVTRTQGYAIGEPHYKRVPRGYDADHTRAELLKYNTMYAVTESRPPKELMSSALLDYCLERWKHMMPLYRWLARTVG
ncbi:TIGR02453 family protein [bacterium]|nr:TIGR02453 family protein [bacterium]